MVFYSKPLQYIVRIVLFGAIVATLIAATVLSAYAKPSPTASTGTYIPYRFHNPSHMYFQPSLQPKPGSFTTGESFFWVESTTPLSTAPPAESSSVLEFVTKNHITDIAVTLLVGIFAIIFFIGSRQKSTS